MKRITGSSWQIEGSSLVTHGEAVTALLSKAGRGEDGVRLEPLRTAIRWAQDGWPEEDSRLRTLVLHGLPSVLDRCGPDDAIEFLRMEAKRIIRRSQERGWTRTGIAFLFQAPQTALRLDLMTERVMYQWALGSVALSHELWNGAARDMREITRADGTVDGYHVLRLS
jgi:hypothetical protein